MMIIKTNLTLTDSCPNNGAHYKTELEKVYQAAKKSYGENFEEDVLVFVFHNFKDENNIPDEVKDSVEKVKKMW